MPGYLEKADYCLRIGKNCRKDPDPYSWACSVKKHKNGEIAEIMGVDRELTIYERKEIPKVLNAWGFRKAFYVRKYEDGSKKVWILTR